MKTSENDIPMLHLQDFDANLGYLKGMEDGIKVGTKIMIDKACEWLSQHISAEDIYDGETNEVPNIYLTVNLYDNMLDFINSFRRAMEE